jgi:hypothetical protein
VTTTRICRALATRAARLSAEIGRPENLAVFRMTVAAALLLAPDLYDAARWAELPAGLRAAPGGLLGALSGLPVTPLAAKIATALSLGGAALALVGLFTRAALVTATLSALYLLTIPQLHGWVTHNHHLVWLAALLCASPCADALSIDALRRPRAVPRSAVAYAAPLLFAWALVAIVFFFPGLHKLLHSGTAWITSDNLANQMRWKWAQTGGLPPAWRVDRSPLLCHAGALGVVGFELSFGALLLSRRLRPAAVACAWLFHLATAVFMRISFFSLAVCYTVFFDWHGAVAALRERLSALSPGLRPHVTPPPRRARSAAERQAWSGRALPVMVVGSVLVGGNLVEGALGRVNDWPFACYPTFDRLVGPEMPSLAAYAVRPDGTRIELPTAPVDTDQTQRLWGMTFSLLEKGARPERFESYWRALSRRPDVREKVAGAASVRFYRAWLSVLPEDRGKPPLREELLFELSP